MLQGLTTNRGGKFYADLAADGPTFFYKLQEVSGQWIDDGSNNFPCVQGASGLTRGVLSIIGSEHSKAVSSVGSDAIGATASVVMPLFQTQSFTVVVTVNTPLTNGAGYSAILHQGNIAASAQQGLLWFIHNDGSVELLVSVASVFHTVTTAAGFVLANTSTLLVLVIDVANSQVLMFNGPGGPQFTSPLWIYGSGDPGGPFNLGSQLNGSYVAEFQGTMQGLCGFTKVISNSRIAQYYTDWP